MTGQPQLDARVVTKSHQSRNIQSLIKEGYEELIVKRALMISDGKINLGRRLLQLVKEDKGIKLFYSYNALYGLFSSG